MAGPQTAAPAVASTNPAAIIIGAGPAGLAVGACLARLNVLFVILEREPSVGSSWRTHYDRLHLHTSKATSALPFLPFPREFPRYPSRDQVIEYVETYARTFRLSPHFDEEVALARRDRRVHVTRPGGAACVRQARHQRHRSC